MKSVLSPVLCHLCRTLLTQHITRKHSLTLFRTLRVRTEPIIAMENNVKSVEDRFHGKIDNYRGVTVRSDEEECGLETLEARLEASLAR